MKGNCSPTAHQEGLDYRRVEVIRVCRRPRFVTSTIASNSVGLRSLPSIGRPYKDPECGEGFYGLRLWNCPFKNSMYNWN
jgi:hypothetical protein